MKKLAVLIDADNSSHKTIEPILEEIAKYGIASVKRIYGDWSNDNLKNWRDVLLPNAITPVQQFSYVKQKDSTDMKLVIDAMDLLYAGELDGFCIVSSDSDFTPLASRIRESGLLCYGFGKKNTVDSFKNACDKFIYVENLLSELYEEEPVESIEEKIELYVENKESNKPITEKSTLIKQVKEVEVDKSTINLFYKAIKDNADDGEGWATLSSIGSYINAVKPDFDTRTYGKQKLSELVKSMPVFETKTVNNQMYVKKFHFAPLNHCVQELLTDKEMLNAGGGWAFVSNIANYLFKHKRKELKLQNLSKEDIEAKIKYIHPNWIDFTKDKKKIRNIPKDKSITTRPIKPTEKKLTGVIETPLFYHLILRYSMGYGDWIPIADIERKLNRIHWDIRLAYNKILAIEELKKTDIYNEIKNLSPKYITLDDNQQSFKFKNKFYFSN